MKTLSFCAVLLISIFSFNTSLAQTAPQGPAGKTETIKVWGNCSMCKATIEKAAKQGGAKTAVWNEDSKELQVSYAVNKTSSVKIQQAIANSGYDTQDLTADQKAYDKLHSCCKYERKDAASSSAKQKCCDDEKCVKEAADCRSAQCCKDKSCCKS